MLSGHPHRPAHQHHQGSVRFQRGDFACCGWLPRQPDGEARSIEDAYFEDVEEVVGPEAEEDIQGAEVGQSHQQRLHSKVVVGEVVPHEHSLCPVLVEQGDSGQGNDKVSDDVPADNGCCKGESQPEDFIPEHRREPAAFRFPQQFGWEGCHWEDQAFALLPLFEKQDAAEKRPHDHGQASCEPAEERPGPDQPGNGFPSPESGIDLIDSGMVDVEKKPFGQVGDDDFPQPVLGRGEKFGAYDGADGMKRPPDGRQIARNPDHGKDGEEFDSGQGDLGHGEFQDRVDSHPEDKGQQYGHGQVTFDQVAAEIGHVKRRGGNGEHAQGYGANCDPVGRRFDVWFRWFLGGVLC